MLIFLAPGAAVAVNVFGDDGSPSAWSKDNQSSDAEVMCQQFIGNRLKAPVIA